MFERKWKVQASNVYIHAFSSESLTAALWLRSCPKPKHHVLLTSPGIGERLPTAATHTRCHLR